MNNAVEKRYAERLKELGPEKRLLIGLELGDLVLEIAKCGIKDKYPDIDDRDLKKKLSERIHLGFKHGPKGNI